MRKMGLTAGLVVLAALATGCGARGPESVDTTVSNPPLVQTSTIPSPPTQADAMPPEANEPTAGTAPASTTTTAVAPAGNGGNQAWEEETGDIDELLAGLDSQLAGLDHPALEKRGETGDIGRLGARAGRRQPFGERGYGRHPFGGALSMADTADSRGRRFDRQGT